MPSVMDTCLECMKFNRSRLLIDGRETFDAIFEAIDHAKDYILIEFYIIKDDRLGQELRVSSGPLPS